MVVTYAIPVLFLFVFLEYLYCKLRKRGRYLGIDTLANLSTGILSRLTIPFTKVISVGAYIYVYEHFRLFSVSDLPTPWFYVALVIAFFAVDFLYYVHHRAAHRINLLWGTHIVHHQSENFNFSVAFRQTAIGSIFTFVFDLPLALLGLSPWWFGLFHGLNLLYQFLIHTEAVGKLGFLEIFMNTPSHHRVHHGRDPKYIDKNYAGMFIIWDKWLGTFQPEEETPTYGVTTPPQNFNPITANYHFFQILWRASKQRKRFIDKVALWFAPPEAVESKSVPQSNFRAVYERNFHLPHLLPVSLFYVLVTVLTFIMLLFAESIEPIHLVAVVLILMTDLPFRIVINKLVNRCPAQIDTPRGLHDAI